MTKIAISNYGLTEKRNTTVNYEYGVFCSGYLNNGKMVNCFEGFSRDYISAEKMSLSMNNINKTLGFKKYTKIVREIVKVK